MEGTFRQFFDRYVDVWKSSSLVDLKELISMDYKAREVAEGTIMDFGYEESLQGWEKGFNFIKENGARWEINEIAEMPLRDDETMMILSAAIIMDDKRLETSNLFMQTFKMGDNNDWKLVRSYIETAIPMAKMDSVQFN